MHLRPLILFAGVLTAASSFGGILTNAVSTAGNQDWNGSLGLEFNVTTSTDVLVTGLGAFDSGLDGFTAGTTISVGIYNRDNQTLVGSMTTFTGTQGSLVGAWREKNASIHLNAGGHYVLVASGFNTSDKNYNTYGGTTNASTNTSSLVTFVGSSLYSGGTGYPGTVDGGPEIRYGAGNMSLTAVPGPPAGLAMMGLAGLFRRRRRRA